MDPLRFWVNLDVEAQLRHRETVMLSRSLLSAALVTLLAVPAAAQDARTADETPSLTWVLDHANELDRRADYVPAAELYEVYAEACLETSTAVLERGSPCQETPEALARAFELQRALGEHDRAAHTAQLFTTHFAYAHPRQTLRIGYEVVEMYLAAGELEQAETALAALEEHEPDGGPHLAVVADALRASIARSRGDARRARRYWQRVERRFARDREALDTDGPIPEIRVRQAVAESRLARAEELVERYFETRAPRLDGVRNDRHWWSRVSPWLVRSRRRLVRARVQLEQVYELGSAEHSVIAAARIGQMYGHQLDMHASLSLPRSEYLVELANLGAQRPGYDEARSHYQTCIAWATHHAVAREWAERCEEGLHGLDPDAYPQQAELHGQATYHPVSLAPAPGTADPE